MKKSRIKNKSFGLADRAAQKAQLITHHSSFITIIIGIMALCGCSPKIISHVREVKDSIIIREALREVRVLIPGDSVTITQIIPCDSLKKEIRIQGKSQRASIQVSLRRGVLIATANCDSLVRQLTLKVKETERRRVVIENNSAEKVVYKTKTIDLLCRWATALSLLFLSLFLTWKMGRRNLY